MTERAKRRPNWRMQALVCGGVVACLAYDMATATEAPSMALLAVQWILLVFGTVGAVGALAMMARGDRKPG